jgi:probable HAF family extracellular repeat protein
MRRGFSGEEKTMCPLKLRFISAAVVPAVLLLTSLLRAGDAASTAPAIYNLGSFGGFSVGMAINASGQVAGYSSMPPNDLERAFRYDGNPARGGTMRNLLTLGGTRSYGRGINNSGQVAGFSETAAGPEHAFRYDGTPGIGGVMRDLGTLGGPVSDGEDVNGSGQVAGWSWINSTGAAHAFRYDGTPGVDGVMRDLGTLGGTNSQGWAINASGQVAGYSYRSGDVVFRAFRFDGTPGVSGVMRDLGTLGGDVSAAFGMNDSGQVVGRSVLSGSPYDRAFRYDGTPGSGGVMRELATLGGARSDAYDINNFGFVVGEAGRYGTGEEDRWATLWLPDRSPVDLDAWLDANNPTLGARWVLIQAWDINDSGLITGEGYYDDGVGGLLDGYRAFLLDASSLVPEPGLGWLVALGLGASRRRRHKKGLLRIITPPPKTSGSSRSGNPSPFASLHRCSERARSIACHRTYPSAPSR